MKKHRNTKNNFVFLCFFIKYLVLAGVVFLSWNYFSPLFVVCLYFLFDIVHKSQKSSLKNFFFYYLSYIIAFHLGAVFWMFYIQDGAIAIFISLLYYLLPFFVYFLYNKYITKSVFVFIPIYVLFELFIDNINFSFPWLIIGNCLANSDYLPQIYEYTGNIGGSIVLLLIAYLLYFHKNIIYVLLTLLLFCFLYIYGYYYFRSDLRENKNIDIQDTEKWLLFNPENYIKKYKYIHNNDLFFYLKEDIKNNCYDKIFIPELTFKSIHFKNFKNSLLFDYFREISIENNTKFYFGASGVLKKGILSNTFVYLDKDTVQVRAKEKLVPFSEYTPIFLRSFLKKYISFDFFISNDWKNFKNEKRELNLICYEIAYSTFVSKSIENVDLIVLLSSEQFLNNSYFGKRQYDNIIRLRAIETRKPIIKASNSGKNIFINQNGAIKNSCEQEFCNFIINKKEIKSYYYTFYSRYIAKKYVYFYFSLIFIAVITLKRIRNLINLTALFL